jgi:hypothetical protein
MRYETHNADHEPVERYGIWSGHGFVPQMDVTPTECIVDILLQERKEAIRDRDDLLAMQKQLGQSGDRDGAKALKGLAQDQMRRYRAVCFHIPWFMSDPPGDCRNIVPPALWPLELEVELDQVGRMIIGADA